MKRDLFQADRLIKRILVPLNSLLDLPFKNHVHCDRIYRWIYRCNARRLRRRRELATRRIFGLFFRRTRRTPCIICSANTENSENSKIEHKLNRSREIIWTVTMEHATLLVSKIYATNLKILEHSHQTNNNLPTKLKSVFPVPWTSFYSPDENATTLNVKRPTTMQTSKTMNSVFPMSSIDTSLRVSRIFTARFLSMMFQLGVTAFRHGSRGRHEQRTSGHLQSRHAGCIRGWENRPHRPVHHQRLYLRLWHFPGWVYVAFPRFP